MIQIPEKKPPKPEPFEAVIQPSKSGEGILFWIKKKDKEYIDPDWVYKCSFEPLYYDPKPRKET